jgi:hypothetical protein
MIQGIVDNYSSLSKDLFSDSFSFLNRVQKKEAHLIAKIAAKDCATAAKLPGESESKYAALKKQVAAKDESPTIKPDNYNPITDSLQTRCSWWSDYVFDKNYKVQSLTHLQLTSKRNKHLPEIPSAKEVVQKDRYKV